MKNIAKFLVLSMVAGMLQMQPVAAAEEGDGWLENYNRAMFSFNTTADDYVIKPVAKGYRAVTNEFIRERVRNFYSNLTEPDSMINHTLQGNFADSGKSLGRFVVNTTLGLLGTFDVASGWGLDKKRTNFDKTMASWCVPDGPFVVLPLLGPSTPRATVGYAATAVANPTYWADYYATFGNDWEKYSFYYGLTALGFISLREENLEFMDNLTESSVDPYSTIKSAYMQNRLKMGACDSGEDNAKDISYDFDFDDEDEI